MSKAEEMYSLMSAYESSGQSRAQFCEESGISIAKFGYWRSKWLKRKSRSFEAETSPGTNFMRFESEVTLSGTPYEIIYPNGIRLRMQNLPIDLLTTLLGHV